MKKKYLNYSLTLDEMTLLEKLYTIHAPSGNEGVMSDFVISKLKNYGCKVWQDEVGNIYAQKGTEDTFPCVVAHLDQVQNYHPSDFVVNRIKYNLIGWSPYDMQQCGLGADDKNGICIALTSAKVFNNIKLAFFVGEEVGCIGSSQCDMNFFKDCRFIIEPDRKGGNDLITTMSGVPVCSQEFIDAIPFERYSYHIEDGIFTDVLTLVENGVGISCINLSCGYYFPHTDHEVTNTYELARCRALVFEIIEKCTDVYPLELPKVDKNKYKKVYSSKDNYDYKDDYNYWMSLYEEMNEKENENNNYDIF